LVWDQPVALLHCMFTHLMSCETVKNKSPLVRHGTQIKCNTCIQLLAKLPTRQRQWYYTSLFTMSQLVLDCGLQITTTSSCHGHLLPIMGHTATVHLCQLCGTIFHLNWRRLTLVGRSSQGMTFWVCGTSENFSKEVLHTLIFWLYKHKQLPFTKAKADLV